MQKTVDKDVGRDRFAAAQTLQHIERLTGEHLEISRASTSKFC